MQTLEIIKWPLLACLLLPWLLGYLGLHVVRRGVIFVDLALAQVAALGTCVSILMGHDVHDTASYVWSVSFTLVGATLFALTRSEKQRVPQEALIGIVYVVSAALGILLLSKSAEGKEELQRSLVGELLVVSPAEIWRPFGLYALIGVVHFIFRARFLELSQFAGRDEVHGTKASTSSAWWDFFFYALFGLVVTSFVHVGGVLLTFSYLIVPAVCAAYLVDSLRSQIIVAWCCSTVASVGSLWVTAVADLPIGATIVCGLGLLLALVIVYCRWIKRPATDPIQSKPT